MTTCQCKGGNLVQTRLLGELFPLNDSSTKFVYEQMVPIGIVVMRFTAQYNMYFK